VEYGILGPLTVSREGHELRLGGARQRSVLAVLLLRANELVPTARIVDELWGEQPPPTAVKAVQVQVSKLRKLLDEGALETRPTGYLLRVEPGALDLQRFESLLEQGRARLAQGDATDAARLLREALGLWRGSPLAEFAYEEFARNEISRLEELRLGALELRLEADLALGRHGEVVGELEGLIREHPMRENLRRLLMLALYRAGRQADALTAYRDARTALVDELGLDPSESLQELEAQILRHDRALDPPAQRIAGVPRLRTLRTNLPVPATEFIGRARELEDVVERLRDGVRLLTLTGPGGTGKTRLALQATAGLTEQFPDGVWWVPLAPLRDPALVLAEVARVLEVDPAGRDFGEALAEVLAGKRMLLLLDNAEHLLPAAGVAIAALRDLDGPRLVVTSRERLQVAGEHVYPVPQLTAPEGLDLFTARAAALDPSFQASPAVQELCDRLDNLPLALELAAARCAVLTPEQMLDRLGDRLDLLKGGRDADPRQQTLRATIAWSYELLARAERDVFARFAVFAGGAPLEAVEDVCESDLETLASLVDKSLVRRDGDRYWMLDTIREYGAERLADAQRAELIERHGGFYERFALDAEAGLRGPRAVGWLAAVEQELPNLRAAMARALERGLGGRAMHISAGVTRYWAARSSDAEGRGWIERALAAGGVAESGRALGSLRAAQLAFFQGDAAVAEAHLRHAAEVAAAAGLAAVEATALAYLAWVALDRGEPEAAGPARERSMALLHEVSDPWERSEALVPLSATELELSTRSALGEEVLRLKRETGDIIGVSDCVNNLGWDALLAGEPDRAIANLEEAAAIAREVDDAYRLSLTTCNLGLAAVMQDRYRDAQELLLEPLQLSIRRGDRRIGAEAVLGLAAAAAGLGDDELSVRLDGIQRDLMAETGYVYWPQVREPLDSRVQLARDRLGVERVATLEAERREPSLEAALELLNTGLRRSVTSANG
jgi:predicted ATPase/DNA-binding SARP family transcriptional activator